MEPVHFLSVKEGPQMTSTKRTAVERSASVTTHEQLVRVNDVGLFPMVQGLRLCTLKAGGPGLIPGQGTRFHMPQLMILHATVKIKDPK